MHSPTARPGHAPSPVRRASSARAARPPERPPARPTHPCRAPSACPWLGCALYCNTMPSLLQPSRHNTLDCIAIQSSIPLAASVTIQYPVLQYNFSSQPTTHSCNTICCIAIQLPALKPSSLEYKNCIAIQFSTPSQLAIHFKFLYQFFFLRFSLYIYIYIYIFNYFQQPEKSLKIIFFFIFLNTQINL